MQLLEIEMTVRDVDAAVAFYQQALELPVASGEGVASREGAVGVSVGTSTLTLVPGPARAGSHHLAITVPAHQFGSAKRWLADRVPLLQRAGVDEFTLPPPWHSQSVYFLGPENVLLELIARHDRPADGIEPCTATSLLGISEVGIAVDHVDAAATAVHQAFGLNRFDSGGPDFAPVGNHHGLLILIAPRRIWFPTTDLTPSPDALAVTLDPGTGTPDTSLLLGSCTLRSVSG